MPVFRGKLLQGRFQKYGKVLEKENQFQEIRWEIQANQSNSSEEDRKQQVSHLKTEWKNEYSRNI